jgi:hypothetical protein
VQALEMKARLLRSMPRGSRMALHRWCLICLETDRNINFVIFTTIPWRSGRKKQRELHSVSVVDLSYRLSDYRHMTVQKLIQSLQKIEDSTQEVKLQDLATNYIYRILTIDKDTGVLLIEDTEE